MAPSVAPLEHLAALLARERRQLELLLFKLTQLRHLLVEGDARFLGWAAEEVERAVDAVRATELERSQQVRLVAPVGAPTDEARLLELLAETASPATARVLRTQRDALTVLAAEVADAVQVTRRLAEAGGGVVASLLERVAPEQREPALLTYGPDSRTAWTAPEPRLRTSL